MAETGWNGTWPSHLPASVQDLLPIQLPYMLSEIVVAVLAVIGNALTLIVFVMDRKLRRLTNYYIASLALADLLVGIFGVPFAILTSVGLPRPLWACLLMLSTLIVLCTISIFCLVAVSVDRYWAILYPLLYSRIMTGKVAKRMIFSCWVFGAFIGFLPLMGWNEDMKTFCVFTQIMDYDYLVFLYFFTIVGPGLLMAVFYGHIYSVVLKQAKFSIRSEHGTLRTIAAQEVPPEGSQASLNHILHRDTTFCEKGSGSLSTGSLRCSTRCSRLFSRRRWKSSFLQGPVGNSFRMDKMGTQYANRKLPIGSNDSIGGLQSLPNASRREVRAAKNLSIIVLFFLICWLPLYTINCVMAFCQNCSVPEFVMNFTIILSHANSAINPILYAYHMKDFRRSLQKNIFYKLGIWKRTEHSFPFPFSPYQSHIFQVHVDHPSQFTPSPTRPDSPASLQQSPDVFVSSKSVRSRFCLTPFAEEFPTDLTTSKSLEHFNGSSNTDRFSWARVPQGRSTSWPQFNVPKENDGRCGCVDGYVSSSYPGPITSPSFSVVRNSLNVLNNVDRIRNKRIAIPTPPGSSTQSPTGNSGKDFRRFRYVRSHSQPTSPCKPLAPDVTTAVPDTADRVQPIRTAEDEELNCSNWKRRCRHGSLYRHTHRRQLFSKALSEDRLHLKWKRRTSNNHRNIRVQTSSGDEVKLFLAVCKARESLIGAGTGNADCESDTTSLASSPVMRQKLLPFGAKITWCSQKRCLSLPGLPVIMRSPKDGTCGSHRKHIFDHHSCSDILSLLFHKQNCDLYQNNVFHFGRTRRYLSQDSGASKT